MPEAGALHALEVAAARRYLCQEPSLTVAAPGTQAIIQALPALFATQDVRLLGPSYGEFARVFAHAGIEVRVCGAMDELAGAGLAIVVNPNNPDGRLAAPRDLAALSETVGGLVADESFMDTMPRGDSLIPHGLGARTLVLRSFGKFYGLAGLRLGFAVTSPALACALRIKLGPWAVGGPALAIGTRALLDDAWPEATRQRLAPAAERLDSLLRAAGFDIRGGTLLFRLARHAGAARVFQRLGDAGILARPFARDTSLLRFGLPESENAFARLARALEGEG